MKKTFKNKALCVILCFLLVFVLSACQGGDVVGTGRPAGVSPEVPVSVPNISSKPESVESEIKDIEDEVEIPYPLEMYFSSGVGAWFTKLVINADDSFTGEYTDSEVDNGPEYPNGTTYISKFSGQFSEVRQVNDYTFALTLETLEVEGEVGESYIEDGIRYIVSNPNGLMNSDDSDYAKDYLLYTPTAPTAELNEDFLSWWPYRIEETTPETLMVYGFCNTQTNTGFFTTPADE